MTNIAKRTLLFFIAVPTILGIVLLSFDPYHLPINLLVLFASCAGTVELSKLTAGGRRSYRAEAFVAGALGLVFPGAALFYVLTEAAVDHSLAFGVTAVSGILIAQVFRRDPNGFADILPSSAGHVFMLVYPGLFLSYVIRISLFPSARFILIVFICMVFFNDTAAYLAGRLFGKGSRGIIPISPKKSLAGFLVGLSASVVVSVLAGLVFPEAFSGAIGPKIALGLAVGLAAIFGDLAESGLKRAVTVKDSGNVIPGRGGFLDSLDSPLFAAPAFFYLYDILFLG